MADGNNKNCNWHDGSRMKVAYLFGAGATHAELANVTAGNMQESAFIQQNSLLLADVSKRVCEEAKKDNNFPPAIRAVLSYRGLSNLELFISLLEKNQVESTEIAVRILKGLLEEDIRSRLKAHKRRFYLHKSLLEFHATSHNEPLAGLISLNYDQVLDEAYKRLIGRNPNYCLSTQEAHGNNVPLLKLHGGFGLKYRKEKLPIITPGISKNYLELPYNFVWGRALEVLLDSDVLRVIGCSLSQNDIGVVDLLFKVHLKRRAKRPLLLQIIDFDPLDNRIAEHLGFFPRLERALEIEGGLIANANIRDPSTGANPFKIWLKAKVERTMSVQAIRKTTYIKRLVE